MKDESHLNALEQGLHNERQRLAAARTPAERELRAVWCRQAEKEIAAELAFLGYPPAPASLDDISDDDLLALLA